jgi:hypothetical protein
MAQIGIVFANINADWYPSTLGTLLLVSSSSTTGSGVATPASAERGARDADTHSPAAADAPPLLEARNVSKYFGAVIAIEGVSSRSAPGDHSARSAITAPASRP